MMAFNASEKSSFKRQTQSKNQVSYADSDIEDNVPLSTRLTQMSSLKKCSSKGDDSVKKTPTPTTTTSLSDKRPFDDRNLVKKTPTATTSLPDKRPFDDRNLVKKTPTATTSLPVKRPLNNMNSVQIPLKKRRTVIALPVKRFDKSNSALVPGKKLKVSPNDDHGKNGGDICLLNSIEKPVKSADKSFSSLKKELVSVEKSFEECKRKRQVEEKRLQSLKRDIEECSKELANKKKEISCIGKIEETHKKMQEKIEECVKDLAAKEAQLFLMEDLIGERKQELKRKETELRQVMDNISKEMERRQVMDNIDKHREGKIKELNALFHNIDECTKELRIKEKDLYELKKSIGEHAEILESERKKLLKVVSISKTDQRAQMNDFESMKKHFEGQVKDHKLKEKWCAERTMVLESKENVFEGRVKKLELKEKQLEHQVKEFEANVEKFQGQKKVLELEKKHLYSRVTELEKKERQFEERARELRSKEKQLEGQLKMIDSKQKKFEGRVKDYDLKESLLDVRVKEFKSLEEKFKCHMEELESEKMHLESRAKELQLKGKQLEDQVKEHHSNEEKFECRVKEFEPKEMEFKCRVKELKHFVSQMEGFISEEKQFEAQGKDLKSKAMKFDGHMKVLESKPNKFDGQLNPPELTKKLYGASIEPFDEETESGSQGSQLSPTTDEFGLFGNDTPVNLQTLSDPSKIVLDIIQDPIIQKCKTGDIAVIIDERHILLLEELMRISPVIEPHVTEEALKLALDLKASMKENNENSLMVLGFLLLVKIYGLAPSFDEDEVLNLFGLVSQHSIAFDLFGDMGFADKVSDFVENLIKRQKYVEAARFSCAYNLGDNDQLVDLLREIVRNVKLISEISCKNTNSIEIKDKARDQEIASLGAIQQCISDNSLESKDLQNEIDDRILELQKQKGT